MDCWGWFFIFFFSSMCISVARSAILVVTQSLQVERLQSCFPPAVHSAKCVLTQSNKRAVPQVTEAAVHAISRDSRLLWLTWLQEHVSRQTNSPLFVCCQCFLFFLLLLFFKYEPWWFPFYPPPLAQSQSFSHSHKAGTHNAAAWVVLHFQELKG